MRGGREVAGLFLSFRFLWLLHCCCFVLCFAFCFYSLVSFVMLDNDIAETTLQPAHLAELVVETPAALIGSPQLEARTILEGRSCPRAALPDNCARSLPVHHSPPERRQHV